MLLLIAERFGGVIMVVAATALLIHLGRLARRADGGTLYRTLGNEYGAILVIVLYVLSAVLLFGQHLET